MDDSIYYDALAAAVKNNTASGNQDNQDQLSDKALNYCDETREAPAAALIASPTNLINNYVTSNQIPYKDTSTKKASNEAHSVNGNKLASKIHGNDSEISDHTKSNMAHDSDILPLNIPPSKIPVRQSKCASWAGGESTGGASTLETTTLHNTNTKFDTPNAVVMDTVIPFRKTIHSNSIDNSPNITDLTPGLL